MDLSSIIYAAIGGGLGGALGAFIASKTGKAGKKSSIATVLSVIFVIGGYKTAVGLYKNMTFPRIVPISDSELEQVLPSLPYIKAENPAAYKALIVPIDQMARSGKITDPGLQENRSNFSTILLEKKATASAQTIRSENDIAVALFKTLKPIRPEVCTLKLYGRPYGDLSDILGSEYQIREQNVLTGYFINAPRSGDVVIDLADGKLIFEKITNDIITELNIANLDPETNADGVNVEDHRKICDFQINLNLRFNALSDEQLFNTYAYLMSL